MPGGLADPAPGQALDEVLRRHVDEQGGVNALALPGEERVERCSLDRGPGKAVEDRPAAGVGACETLLEHPDGHGVGDQLAGVHVRLGFEADRRGVANRGTEEVAGRDVRDPQPFAEDDRLRALAGPRRPEQDDERHPCVALVSVVPVASARASPGQGAAEHPSERTPTCVSEGAQAATPAWAVRADAEVIG